MGKEVILRVMDTTGARIKAVITSIPEGRVTSYGAIAAMAGLPNGARTVARVLHSCSEADRLPWWRVLKADGGIALQRGYGFEEQAALLRNEGIPVDASGKVDLASFAWDGK